MAIMLKNREVPPGALVHEGINDCLAFEYLATKKLTLKSFKQYENPKPPTDPPVDSEYEMGRPLLK